MEKQEEGNELQVDPVDALPVKTLDGKLYYRRCMSYLSPMSLSPLASFSIFSLFLDSAKLSDAPENGGNEEAMEEDQVDNGVLKLTKAERRAKQKKIKKISKKQEDVTQAEEVQPTSQAAVLVFFRDFTFLFFFKWHHSRQRWWLFSMKKRWKLTQVVRLIILSIM